MPGRGAVYLDVSDLLLLQQLLNHGQHGLVVREAEELCPGLQDVLEVLLDRHPLGVRRRVEPLQQKSPVCTSHHFSIWRAFLKSCV